MSLLYNNTYKEFCDMCGIAGLVNIKYLEDRGLLERKFNNSYIYLKIEDLMKRECGIIECIFFTYKTENPRLTNVSSTNGVW